MARKRPNGDGSVRRRPDGRWEGRIVVGYKDNGNPMFRSVYAKTQKELLRKLHANLDSYRDVKLTEESRMSLGEWLDTWLETYVRPTTRPATHSNYMKIVNSYIKPVLGEKPVYLITQMDVQKMYHNG